MTTPRPVSQPHPFKHGGLLSATCAEPGCLQAPESPTHRMDRPVSPMVYVNEYEPWLGVLVSDVASVEDARRAVEAEMASDLPVHYLGIRTEPILKENGAPGRRRRFHVFTDEPQ